MLCYSGWGKIYKIFFPAHLTTNFGVAGVVMWVKASCWVRDTWSSSDRSPSVTIYPDVITLMTPPALLPAK